jgi:hypothetical protein
MPKKINWNFVGISKFKDLNEFKDWYSGVNAIVKHNNSVTCTSCCGGSKPVHQMNEIRLVCNSQACNNKERTCEFKYKVLHCSKQHEKYRIYEHGVHAGVPDTDEKKRGIKNYVKDMIKECIYEKDISLPAKIQIKLRGKKFKCKFNEEVDIPSLEQIQNYVKYLKRKLGDNNKISDVKKFAKANKYHEDIGDDEFFVFGEEFGSGGDNDHFQIGFTSKRLLSRIPDGVIFHCDGTYKIIKFGFPLIVFGISDINRKFWPVGFMFTSHEQKKDYYQFFDKLKKISALCDITFDPKYMIIDACKSMAYAIKRCFPNCKINLNKKPNKTKTKSAPARASERLKNRNK